ncbi:MAG: hypothetical protein R2715_20455 [Ilumatobacteraceae bacterium]
MQRRTGERMKRPWIVRWAVGGRQRSRSFRTRPEADRFRSGLFLAQQSGEAFDETTGEPASWAPRTDAARAHLWAERWLPEQWDEWALRARVSAIEALARLSTVTSPSPTSGSTSPWAGLPIVGRKRARASEVTTFRSIRPEG